MKKEITLEQFINIMLKQAAKKYNMKHCLFNAVNQCYDLYTDMDEKGAYNKISLPRQAFIKTFETVKEKYA